MILKIKLFLLIPLFWTSTTASNHCIEGCTCDIGNSPQKLYVRNCEGPLKLTPDAVAKLSSVSNIYFENNVIETIASGTFSKFDQLQLLSFQKCTINKIDPTALEAENLIEIDFKNVRFVELPVIKSADIETLSFINCNLIEVPDLNSLPNLKDLNLANNKLSVLPEDVFSNLDSLDTLNITNNNIKTIPSKLFEKDDLTTLVLDNNPISTIEINTKTNLEFLSCKSCNFSVVDQRLTQNLQQLSNLYLSDNHISSLPIDVFEPLTDLTDIDLSNNLLVEVDAEIFATNNILDNIVLDNNAFTELPKFILKGSNLTTNRFSCNNCKLTSLNGVFDAMSALTDIYLSGNNIETLSKEHFKNIRGLKTLDLSKNKIKTIPLDTFEGNTDLEILNLSGNQLSPLDPSIFAKNQIAMLDISNNGLSQIWLNNNQQITVEKIIIAKNNLNKITINDLKVMKQLTLIDLHDNPLQCNDNEFAEVIRYLINRNIGFLDQQQDLDSTHALIDPKTYWTNKYKNICNKELEPILEDKEDDKLIKEDSFDLFDKNDRDEQDDYDQKNYYDEDDDDDDDEDDDEDDDDDIVDTDTSYNEVEELAMGSSLPYILSLTSIFIITAVAVLCIVLTIAIFVLKRKNPSFANDSPRFRLPIFLQSTYFEKNHSGSVYQHLTEDFETPRPSFKYEFKPNVHGQDNV